MRLRGGGLRNMRVASYTSLKFNIFTLNDHMRTKTLYKVNIDTTESSNSSTISSKPQNNHKIPKVPNFLQHPLLDLQVHYIGDLVVTNTNDRVLLKQMQWAM